jgi:hypothetical protein
MACQFKNLLPYQDPWVVNPLYFVPSILPSQERIKFFVGEPNKGLHSLRIARYDGFEGLAVFYSQLLWACLYQFHF